MNESGGQKQTAFRIDGKDNVATVLAAAAAGRVEILGDGDIKEIAALEEIPEGHKIALQDIETGEYIYKYGVVIGRASLKIKKGSWVHLHCMKSLYDERG